MFFLLTNVLGNAKDKDDHDDYTDYDQRLKSQKVNKEAFDKIHKINVLEYNNVVDEPHASIHTASISQIWYVIRGTNIPRAWIDIRHHSQQQPHLDHSTCREIYERYLRAFAGFLLKPPHCVQQEDDRLYFFHNKGNN